MARLVPAIHDFLVAGSQDVDARHKAGVTGCEAVRSLSWWPCAGHPGLACCLVTKRWMAAERAGMTTLRLAAWAAPNRTHYVPTGHDRCGDVCEAYAILRLACRIISTKRVKR